MKNLDYVTSICMVVTLFNSKSYELLFVSRSRYVPQLPHFEWFCDDAPYL